MLFILYFQNIKCGCLSKLNEFHKILSSKCYLFYHQIYSYKEKGRCSTHTCKTKYLMPMTPCSLYLTPKHILRYISPNDNTAVVIFFKPTDNTAVIIFIQPTDNTAVVSFIQPTDNTAVVIFIFPNDNTAVVIFIQLTDNTAVVIFILPNDNTAVVIFIQPTDNTAVVIFISPNDNTLYYGKTTRQIWLPNITGTKSPWIPTRGRWTT